MAMLPGPSRKARLNIALAILHANPAKGGAETYTVDLARALIERGEQVSILASSFAENLDSRIVQVSLSQRGPTRLAKYECFLDALDDRLLATPYDVVHAMLPVRRCDLYHPHAGIAAAAVAAGHLKHSSILRRAASRLANRMNRKRARFAAVERELLLGTQADAVTARWRPPIVISLSEYIKSTVRRHYPLPDDQLATLVNAVDLQKFDPTASADAGRQTRERLGLLPGKIAGLIVAQDFARKGLREAIEAWRLVNDDRLAMVVVGKDDFGPYAKLAASAAYSKNLVFAGATRDVRPFYAAADFFVLPTRHDPCSLVVLEALAMGLPVLSTRFNGACEVMTPGVHGSVLDDPADVPALADAMRDLLNDRLRQPMREACLALRPRLAYEHHLEELIKLYRQAIAARLPVQGDRTPSTG